MTVKTQFCNNNHGRSKKLHMKAYSLFCYYRQSIIYKTRFTPTAEAEELCIRARVLSKR